MYTTNYYSMFMEIADDCPIKFGEVPPQKCEHKTVATLQYEMLRDHPYKYTSDDIVLM